VLEITGLEKAADRRAGKFSLGMSQRLGIAAALLGDPAVLLLDEPVNGLDPEGIRWIRNLLKNLAAQGRTVLISSHLISEVAQTADRLVVIGQGRLLAQTTVADSPPAATPSRRRSSRSPRAAPTTPPATSPTRGASVMTTATLTRSATRPEPGYSFRSAARMEWLKLRSVRSTPWILLVFAVRHDRPVRPGAEPRALGHDVRRRRAAFDPTTRASPGWRSASSSSASSACSRSPPSSPRA
jgi:ABC-type glutathione transport system ATPase component